MGAPITAYNRISKTPCTIHSNIYKPDYVVVVDESLLHTVDVTAGLNPEGGIIINSPKAPSELKPLLRGYQGAVYTVDARRISEQCLGKYFPNTPMLAAVVQVSQVVDSGQFVANMRDSYQHKFSAKPHVIQGNMDALITAMKEVRKA
jgi:pyruvate ferredoxin oxidoreductase gamma subunit